MLEENAACPLVVLPSFFAYCIRHRSIPRFSGFPWPLPVAAMADQEYQSTKIIFKDYVNEGEVPLDNFVVEQETVKGSSLQEGGVLLETLYLSVDPYMRPKMRNAKNYTAAFEPGKPLAGGAVAVVKASKAEGFKEGEVVVGFLPWATFNIVPDASKAGLNKVPSEMLGKVPLSYFLGTLGMPGLTAYVGIHMIGQPKEGETVFISAATGAVGQVAGQLFKKVHGCKVIGSVGSGDKVALLKELGFDAAFNYKTTDTREALKEHAPNGIDIYWENVGGETLDVVLDQANKFARIICCGMISQYNLPEKQRYGVKNLFQVVGKEIKMQGFIVGSHREQYGADFNRDMAKYVQEGQLVVKEHATEGIESIGKAFIEMMKGGNIGKAVIKVAKEDPFPAAKK